MSYPGIEVGRTPASGIPRTFLVYISWLIDTKSPLYFRIEGPSSLYFFCSPLSLNFPNLIVSKKRKPPKHKLQGFPKRLALKQTAPLLNYNPVHCTHNYNKLRPFCYSVFLPGLLTASGFGSWHLFIRQVQTIASPIGVLSLSRSRCVIKRLRPVTLSGFQVNQREFIVRIDSSLFTHFESIAVTNSKTF